MKNVIRNRKKSESTLVSSLMIPVQNKNLLVPNVVVAEVIELQDLIPADGLPEWCSGYTEWRGERLPVVNFEVINNQSRGVDADTSRLAVFNAVSGASSNLFFGVVIQSIPRMLKLTEADVREDKQAQVGQAEKMSVVTQLGKAVIPDLDYVESLLGQLP